MAPLFHGGWLLLSGVHLMVEVNNSSCVDAVADNTLIEILKFCMVPDQYDVTREKQRALGYKFE